MGNIKINYASVIRAFNKVRESSEIKNKTKLLSSLSDLIDKSIRNTMQQTSLDEVFDGSIIVTKEELQYMLSELEKGNIVLYDGLLNEQALVSEKQ